METISVKVKNIVISVPEWFDRLQEIKKTLISLIPEQDSGKSCFSCGSINAINKNISDMIKEIEIVMQNYNIGQDDDLFITDVKAIGRAMIATFKNEMFINSCCKFTVTLFFVKLLEENFNDF
mgnify:CR=1 FL=1